MARQAWESLSLTYSFIVYPIALPASVTVKVSVKFPDLRIEQIFEIARS